MRRLDSSRLRRTLAIAAGLAVTLASSAADAARFRKGPYLLWAGSDTAMSLQWQTDATPETPVTLAWGDTPAVGTGSMTLSENSAAETEHLFIATLYDLTPGGRVFYAATVDGVTLTGSFLTPQAPDARFLTFYALGDTQDYPARFDTIAGRLLDDAAVLPERRQRLVLHTGDWVSNGSSEADWQLLLESTWPNLARLFGGLMVIGARGNHEANPQLLRKYLAWPVVPPKGAYFSFDYGPLHVAVIDLYVAYHRDSEQARWLGRDLRAARDKLKVLVFHEPAYSAGGAHPNSAGALANLVPFVRAFGVQLILSGHNHYYARVSQGASQYLTVGMGGGSLYTPDPSFHVAAADKSHGFARFDVTPSALYGWGMRVDGSQIEQYVLPREPDLKPPTVAKAEILPGGSTLTLRFSEALTLDDGDSSSLRPGHFGVSEGTLTQISVDATMAEAQLALSPPVAAHTWVLLQLTGLTDLFGNLMPDTTVELLVPPESPDGAESVDGAMDGGDARLNGDSAPAATDAWFEPWRPTLESTGCSCRNQTRPLIMHAGVVLLALLGVARRARQRRHRPSERA